MQIIFNIPETDTDRLIFQTFSNTFLLSQRESFVTVKIFESKILINFDVFEHPESE